MALDMVIADEFDGFEQFIQEQRDTALPCMNTTIDIKAVGPEIAHDRMPDEIITMSCILQSVTTDGKSRPYINMKVIEDINDPTTKTGDLIRVKVQRKIDVSMDDDVKNMVMNEAGGPNASWIWKVCQVMYALAAEYKVSAENGTLEATSRAVPTVLRKHANFWKIPEGIRKYCVLGNIPESFCAPSDKCKSRPRVIGTETYDQYIQQLLDVYEIMLAVCGLITQWSHLPRIVYLHSVCNTEAVAVAPTRASHDTDGCIKSCSIRARYPNKITPNKKTRNNLPPMTPGFIDATLVHKYVITFNYDQASPHTGSYNVMCWWEFVNNGYVHKAVLPQTYFFNSEIRNQTVGVPDTSTYEELAIRIARDIKDDLLETAKNVRASGEGFKQPYSLYAFIPASHIPATTLIAAVPVNGYPKGGGKFKSSKKQHPNGSFVSDDQTDVPNLSTQQTAVSEIHDVTSSSIGLAGVDTEHATGMPNQKVDHPTREVVATPKPQVADAEKVAEKKNVIQYTGFFMGIESADGPILQHIQAETDTPAGGSQFILLDTSFRTVYLRVNIGGDLLSQFGLLDTDVLMAPLVVELLRNCNGILKCKRNANGDAVGKAYALYTAEYQVEADSVGRNAYQHLLAQLASAIADPVLRARCVRSGKYIVPMSAKAEISDFLAYAAGTMRPYDAICVTTSASNLIVQLRDVILNAGQEIPYEAAIFLETQINICNAACGKGHMLSDGIIIANSGHADFKTIDRSRYRFFVIGMRSVFSKLTPEECNVICSAAYLKVCGDPVAADTYIVSHPAAPRQSFIVRNTTPDMTKDKKFGVFLLYAVPVRNNAECDMMGLCNRYMRGPTEKRKAASNTEDQVSAPYPKRACILPDAGAPILAITDVPKSV